MSDEQMARPPWASGPGEILQHGLSLLRKDSDVNRRLAMLSIDNSVELMIKTYLGLPKRVTGLNLSHKEYLEISESFPRLLASLEQHAIGKLAGIDLGEIEWFHRVRNELYHQGNGLTVEKDKVKVYAEIAKLLFRNLFGFDLQVKEADRPDILGAFMAAWVTFEQVVRKLNAEWGPPTTSSRPIFGSSSGRRLASLGLITQETAQEIGSLWEIRNQIVHGVGEHRVILRPEMVERVKIITQELEQLLQPTQ